MAYDILKIFLNFSKMLFIDKCRKKYYHKLTNHFEKFPTILSRTFLKRGKSNEKAGS